MAIHLTKYNELYGVAESKLASDQSLVTLWRSAVFNIQPFEDACPVGQARCLEARFWAFCFMDCPISFIPDDSRKYLSQRTSEGRQFAARRHSMMLNRNICAGDYPAMGLPPPFSHQKPALSQSV